MKLLLFVAFLGFISVQVNIAISSTLLREWSISKFIGFLFFVMKKGSRCCCFKTLRKRPLPHRKTMPMARHLWCSTVCMLFKLYTNAGKWIATNHLIYIHSLIISSILSVFSQIGHPGCASQKCPETRPCPAGTHDENDGFCCARCVSNGPVSTVATTVG